MKTISAYQKIKELSQQEIQELINSHTSLSKVLSVLQVNSGDPRLRKLFLQQVSDYQLTWKRKTNNTIFDTSDEEFTGIVKESICFSDIIRTLGKQPDGGNLTTVKNRIISLGLDIGHFDLQRAFSRGKDRVLFDPTNLTCIEQITHKSSLRKIILKHKLIPYVCGICDAANQWRGQPLTLELDHINGNSSDHKLDNLRFLCPNCHSQTETFGRKNKKKLK